MTTIATDGKTMAGDGLINGDGVVHGRSFPKVRALEGGVIIGLCGCICDVEPFLAWMDGGPKPRLEKGFQALLLSPGGPPRLYYGDLKSEPVELPYAIGSGGHFALAAMDFGKTPEEAVRYAATRDIHTGGTITVLELHAKPKLAA